MFFSKSQLTAKQYDDAETAAMAFIPIPQMMAFRPVAFQSVGWPIHVSTEPELLRYVDHNFESEVAALFEPGAEFAPVGYRNAFTLDEKEIIATIRDHVADLTENSFGRRIKPVTNLLVQLGPFRMVQQLSALAKNEKPAMFEVGPGAGYLGALLAQAGHRYMSYDVAQSLYLWQNRLLAAVAGSDFCETANMNQDAAAHTLERSRIGHLPWWQYANLLNGTSIWADLVYSNSNLSEMTNLALRHVLHISRFMLADSDIGMFCFFSKGMPSQTPHDQLDNEFQTFGYHKVFESPFFAYTLNEAQASRIKRTFENGLEPYNPSGRDTILEAKDVVPIRRAEAPLDTQLTQWLHGWQPPFVD